MSDLNLTDAQLTEAAQTAALLDEGFITDCGNGYAVRVPGCEPWFFADLTAARRAVRWAMGVSRGGDGDESIVVEGQVTG